MTAVACGAGFANNTSVEGQSQTLSPNAQYLGGSYVPTPVPTLTYAPAPTDTPDPTPSPDTTGTPTPGPSPRVTKAPCPPAAANSVGVGAACTANTNCGSDAPYCTGTIPGVAAASFCTKACSSAGACGNDAHCLPDARNAKLFLCIPDACIPDGTDLNVTPTPLAACLPSNATGVGKACTSALQCTFGYLCTGTSAPVSFCTKLCSTNNDCGAGNTCETDPASGRMACVPNSCIP